MKINYQKVLLVVLFFTIISSILTLSFTKAQQEDDEDDILDVSDETFETTDQDRRSRFSGSHPESQMEFEDFSEEARYRQKKQEKKQQQQQQQQQQEKEKKNTKKEQHQKRKDEYYKEKSERTSSSSKKSSSSSYTPPPAKATLTEKVANLIKNLEGVKSDFAARKNHLIRISNPAGLKAVTEAQQQQNDEVPAILDRHFNTSLNSESSLKLLSQVISSFGIPYIVDGDVLNSANSALASARYDAKSYRNKIDAAEKQQQKAKGSAEIDGAAPVGDNLPTKDHKIIALRKNIKIAESLIDELVAEEMRQRVTHKRLLRSGRMAAPYARKYINDVVAATDVRLAEMRGIRSGEIDNAAPSSGNAREERRARKEFQSAVKTLKQAQTNFMTYEKLLAARNRGGNGLTKAMEPLFVFTQMLARDSLNDDCMALLQAADEVANDREEQAFTTFGNFILQQYKNHGEKHFDKETKQADKDLASTIYELQPTPTTGVIFGLDTAELVGLVLCLVVPMQVFHICFVLVSTFVLKKKNDEKTAAQIYKARIRKHKNAGKAPPSSSNKKPQTSFPLVLFLTFFQIALVFVFVNIPILSQRLEDIPLHLHNHDVSLPSVLFSALRLQVSEGTQARLACACFLLCLFQGLSVARSIAVHSPVVVNKDDDEEEEEEE